MQRPRTRRQHNLAGTHSARLYTLPEELIKSIFEQLAPVRCFNVDATGREENRRRAENKRRIRGLLSLCLTSRQLSRVAAPVLYSAFILEGSRRRRTKQLTAYAQATLRRPWLRKCLLYVEQMHDPLPKRSEKLPWHEVPVDTSFDEPLTPLAERVHILQKHTQDQGDARHHSELALALLMAPNLTHITICVVHDTVPYFCDFAGFSVPHDKRQNFPEYFKVETLCLAAVTMDWKTTGNIRGAISWRNMSSTLQRMPALKYLQLSGLWFYDGDDPSSGDRLSTLGALPNLQTIILHGTSIDTNQLSTFVSGCTSLQGVHAQWGKWAMHAEPLMPQNLFNALLPMAKSLEVLSILTDISTGIFPGDPWNGFIPQHTFSSFDHLRALHIPDAMLFGTPMGGAQEDWGTFRPPLRIAQCLPLSLELLIIFQQDKVLNDIAVVLWDFADDLPSLPRLTQVMVENYTYMFDYGNGGTGLTRRFEEQGVRLSWLRDRKYPECVVDGRYMYLRRSGRTSFGW